MYYSEHIEHINLLIFAVVASSFDRGTPTLNSDSVPAATTASALAFVELRGIVAQSSHCQVSQLSWASVIEIEVAVGWEGSSAAESVIA